MSGLSLDAVFSAIAAAGTMAIALVGLMFVYDRRRAAKYDEGERRAQLESMRNSIETQMYELSRRQLATETRWRDANHLLVDSQGYQQSGATSSPLSLTPFLKGAGLTVDDLRIDPRLVFVLTPFHAEFRDTYRVIADVCRELGLQALRGDEEYIPNDLMNHILRLMVRSRLIIANVDGRNPNVFYELGIAHALNKTTILLGSSSADLPIDVRARKIVLAENPDDLRELLTKEISRSLVGE